MKVVITLANGNTPSLVEIIGKLELVLNGLLTRENVSDWAGLYILNDELRISDEKVCKLLNIVFGMDTKDSPTEYLHTDEEIKGWIEEYK